MTIEILRVERDIYTDTHGRRAYPQRFLALDGETVLGAGDTPEDAAADAARVASEAGIGAPEAVVVWDQDAQ